MAAAPQRFLNPFANTADRNFGSSVAAAFLSFQFTCASAALWRGGGGVHSAHGAHVRNASDDE